MSAATRARCSTRSRSPRRWRPGGAPPTLVVASDHLVSYEERVCDTLSAGAAAAFLVGASGGVARLGPLARAGREVYDVWRLGTEPEARYRLEVLFDAYGAERQGGHGRAWSGLTERPIGRATPPVCASQPHPQTLRGLGKAGGRAPSSSRARASWARSATWARPRSASPWRSASTRAAPGEHLVALGYGGGEAIAQDVEVTGPVPAAGRGRPDPRRGDRLVHVLPLDPRPPGRTPLGRRDARRRSRDRKDPPQDPTREVAAGSGGGVGPRRDGRRRASSPRTSSRSTSATSGRSASTTRTRPG